MSHLKHTLPNKGENADWLTPPELVKALGGPKSFDLDPCCPPNMPWRTARKMISRPRDGLAARWTGRVFLNPPYGTQTQHWLEKLAHHNNGIALVPARTEVESWFWPYIWEKASALYFLRGRLHYYYPDGLMAHGNAGHGSVLAAYGQLNVATLRNLASLGQWPGRFINNIGYIV